MSGPVSNVDKKSEREARLAERLRANLRRRKDVARKRKAEKDTG